MCKEFTAVLRGQTVSFAKDNCKKVGNGIEISVKKKGGGSETVNFTSLSFAGGKAEKKRALRDINKHLTPIKTAKKPLKATARIRPNFSMA